MSTANLSNWRESPHSIWGFQNVDKLIKTNAIQKGSKVTPLESAPKSINDFRIKQGERMDMDLQAFMAATETDGLVVLQHGKVVFEHYDMDGATYAEGVHRMGDFRMVWFKDPDGNILHLNSAD